MSLRIESVGKRYGGDRWGLRDFSLEIASGVLGLLGPNGSGKSTLMRILATVTRPTTGQVLWEGSDISQAPEVLRDCLGYLPQDFGVYPHLSAPEFLHYLAAAKGLGKGQATRRIDELLQAVNLHEFRDRRLKDYSGGMRQRVGIAQALLNDPRLLIVDEPTVGLDPEERIRFRNLLTELTADRIVVLSTHIVSDVEAVANRIALLHRGRLLRDARPEEFLADASGRVWEMVATGEELEELRSRFPIVSAVRRSQGVVLRCLADARPAARAREVEPRLEDAYLRWISTAAGAAS